MNSILVTGGCGFVGSSIAIKLKSDYPELRVVTFDNLRRRGSELNIKRLKEIGVEFIHGDVRSFGDLEAIGKCDLVIECSAEPSVLAGFNESPQYLLQTNLVGTINCLEYARIFKSRFIFLSTSRVYPITQIEKLKTIETDSRFELHTEQLLRGVSSHGISEEFSMNGVRSLYGASKLASELLIAEYCQMYDLNAIINRCGLLTGPWQFGKVDQGVIVLWVARHYWGKGIKYIGYGGKGKQVRDLLHIDDLYQLLKLQIKKIDSFQGEIFNVGGGNEISCSLLELTKLCQEVTGNIVKIEREYNNRIADIKIYITDSTKVSQEFSWAPMLDAKFIVSDIHNWIKNNSNQLKDILN